MTKDVIDEMLNDFSKSRDKISLIYLDDIVPSESNKDYPMMSLDSLALGMRICGQLEPCVVWEKTPGVYTMISGERRWRAAKLNVDRGFLEFEELKCIVKHYSSNADAERELRVSNSYRESLPIENKVAITKAAIQDYIKAKENGEIETGTKKRQWISAITGFGERSVQTYLNMIAEEAKPAPAENVIKEDNLYLYNVQDVMMHKLQTKTKVTEKFIKINYCGTEDLNRILELLDCLEAE